MIKKFFFNFQKAFCAFFFIFRLIIIEMRKKPIHEFSQPNFNFLDPSMMQGNYRAGQFEGTKLPASSGYCEKQPGYYQSRYIRKYKGSENQPRIGSPLSPTQSIEDMMTDAFYKRKQQNSQSRLHKNISHSNISVADSTSRLPLINSRTLQHNSEQSKLQAEIERVQNKIKELKFERNLTSTQQDKYQTLRPLIQMQNQNMMNMQMMMTMLSQQNRQQKPCCHHNNSQNSKVQYIPIPIYPPYPQSFPPQSFPPQSYPQNYSPNSPQDRRELLSPQNNSKKTKTKKYNLKKLRKFRAAVIAVYFSLIFPKYVKAFTKRRFEIHSQKYFIKGEDYYSKIIPLSLECFSKINFYKIAKQVELNRKEKEIRRVAKSKTAKLVITQEYGEAKNYEIFLGDIEIFLLMTLQKIIQDISKDQFNQIIKHISAGNLPFAFPIDNYYLPEELYRLKFNKNKLYLQIDEAQSKALIMTIILIKLLVYDYLFTVREDNQWKLKLLKQNNLKKTQMIEAEVTATQMYISGVLLHRFCMDILRDEIKNTEGNIDKINQSNIPIPMGTMIYQAKQQLESYSKNTLSDKNSEKGKKQQKKGEQLDGKLYQFEYIKKMGEFSPLVQQIIAKASYYDEIRDKISELLDMLYSRALQMRKQEYKEISNSVTLPKQLKAFDLVSANDGFSFGKRTKDEQDEVNYFLKQYRSDKARERVDIEDSQESESIKSRKRSSKVNTVNLKKLGLRR